jgi:hypothetical protein
VRTGSTNFEPSFGEQPVLRASRTVKLKEEVRKMKPYTKTPDLKVKDGQLIDEGEPKFSTNGLFPIRVRIRHDDGYLMRLYRKGFVPKEGYFSCKL